MNPVHIHLYLSHAPVVMILIGTGLLAGGTWTKSVDLSRGGLSLLILACLITVPLYLTGEPSENAVKGLPGFSDRVLDQHQSLAGAALAGCVLLALVALLGLCLYRAGKAMPGWFAFAMISGSLVVAAVVAWTANLGGQIRHSEIRANETQMN